jgi:hypothetical protein
MIKTDIFDEIINCGISSEDTILQLGVGYKNGSLLYKLCEYWDLNSTEINKIIGLDIDPNKTESLSEIFSNIQFVKNSMQEYLDTVENNSFNWCILTGVFDKYLYDDLQHNFVFKTVNRCLELSENGVVFTLKVNVSDEFSYNPVFIFADFVNTHSTVFVKKLENNTYVFCILK